ncbi:hypothetical protein OS175_04490 [Marinicella sp. S1101]|uniref:hypothetical protein n=1 Tax=Marinicella marina TaxID=2996016 RepID=UPI002260DC86|nr:hypothetical protein [Marinicella marina]MCX7553125.1 hypothetical protein [Marinicella marina]MDJ1138857.1 hypothetical protein [Marinicella marina]
MANPDFSKFNYTTENIFSKALLDKMALNRASHINSLSTWFLGGVTASYILFFSNISKLFDFFSSRHIQILLAVFLIFLFISILQKMHFTAIKGSVEGGETGSKLSNEILGQNEVNQQEIINNLMNASFFWMKWRINRLAKLDEMGVSRYNFKLSQWMEVLLYAQFLLIVFVVIFVFYHVF